MTTPRDDIGLSERLRKRVFDDSDLEQVTAERREAATQLDALSARVKELERERDHYLSSWKEARTYLNIETRHAEGAEALAEAAESRATRAKQERDEAYARLEPFASVASWLGSAVPDSEVMYRGPGSSITAGHLRAARDLVRRLAAGTEKEKRE